MGISEAVRILSDGARQFFPGHLASPLGFAQYKDVALLPLDPFDPECWYKEMNS